MSPIVHQFERKERKPWRGWRLSPAMELRIVKAVLATDIAVVVALAVWYAT